MLSQVALLMPLQQMLMQQMPWLPQPPHLCGFEDREVSGRTLSEISVPDGVVGNSPLAGAAPGPPLFQAGGAEFVGGSIHYGRDGLVAVARGQDCDLGGEIELLDALGDARRHDHRGGNGAQEGLGGDEGLVQRWELHSGLMARVLVGWDGGSGCC